MTVQARRAVWAVLLLLSLGLLAFALRGGLALGEAPISGPPSVAPKSAAAATSSPAPGETSAPGSGSASAGAASSASDATGGARPSSAPAASAPSFAPSGGSDLLDGPAAPWDRITAAPVHVDIRHGDEQLVGAPIRPTHLDAGGQLNPERTTVGWYGPPQWATTPGERSASPGILAGHVIHSGFRDVFWRLQEARAGDLVLLTYDDGTQAAFRVDRDPVSIEKQALTHDPAYDWAWRLSAPGNVVTLITCDLVPGSGMTGASLNNWVVQATRVQ